MREWTKTPAGEAYKKRQAAYMRQWRKDNREKSKAILRRSYDKIRLECMQHYSGQTVPSCRCCGEAMLAFLHLDHKHGDGAAFRKEWALEHGKIAGGTSLYYWLKREGWPDIGLQVLCANCNLSKRAGRYCAHEIARGVDMDGQPIEVS